jgi:hypothetical protein
VRERCRRLNNCCSDRNGRNLSHDFDCIVLPQNLQLRPFSTSHHTSTPSFHTFHTLLDTAVLCCAVLCCAVLCCAVIQYSVSCWDVQHRVILFNVTVRCVLCGVLCCLTIRLRRHLLLCFSFLYSSLLIFFLSFPLPYCLPYLSRHLPPITAISRSTITAPIARLR